MGALLIPGSRLCSNEKYWYQIYRIFWQIHFIPVVENWPLVGQLPSGLSCTEASRICGEFNLNKLCPPNENGCTLVTLLMYFSWNTVISSYSWSANSSCWHCDLIPIPSTNKGGWQKSEKYVAQNNLAPAVTQAQISTWLLAVNLPQEVAWSQLCLLPCSSFCAKLQLGRRTCKSARGHSSRIIPVLHHPVGHQKERKSELK